jgi:hypothetical protein
MTAEKATLINVYHTETKADAGFSLLKGTLFGAGSSGKIVQGESA